MKSLYSLERRDMIGSLNKGKQLSDAKETRQKLRQKALARSPRIFTEQALLNMKKKSKPIILYNLDYTVYGEYPSIVEGSKAIRCNEKTIIRSLKTENKLLKRR